ncbi:MAG: NADH-quinone oxidoreductase subunit N [Opitutales bacterium]
MNYSNLTLYLLPEIVVLLTALSMVGLGCTPACVRMSGRGFGWIALSGIGIALVVLLCLPSPATLPEAVVVHDPLTRLFKAALCLLAVGTLLLGSGEPTRSEARVEGRALLLFALIGLMVVVGTEHLLVLFIGLELASLALYILVAFENPGPRQAEAALKYFFIGSVAAAFLLFGLSLLFGISGSLELRGIAETIGNMGADPVLLVAIAFILVGFGFKVAAVPFHLWAPDAYQAAPVSVAGFIASASKVAGFFIAAKFLLIGLGTATGNADWGEFGVGWAPLLAALATLSMLIGNIGALAQRSVTRIMAFSGVGHSGFVLAALAAAQNEALRAVLFYSLIYGLANLTAFGVIGLVRRSRESDAVEAFAGLGRSSPLAASALVLALLSLAGLPPLAGFFGKFQLFAAALSGGIDPAARIWLVGIALFMSAVSLYYYLRILKYVFFAESTTDTPITSDSQTKVVLIVSGALLILLGLIPGPLLAMIEAALVQGS